MGSAILERKNKQQTILIREASQQTKNIGSITAAITTVLIFTWAIRSSCMGVHQHHNHNRYHPEEMMPMVSSPAFLPPQHESLSSSSSTNYIGNTKLKRRYIIQNSNINDVQLGGGGGGLRK